MKEKIAQKNKPRSRTGQIMLRTHYEMTWDIDAVYIAALGRWILYRWSDMRRSVRSFARAGDARHAFFEGTYDFMEEKFCRACLI